MTRGGKRTGAGRKPDPGTVKAVSIAVSMHPACWQWVGDQEGTRSGVIQRLVEKEIKNQEEEKMEDHENSCSDCKFCFREHNAGDLMCGFPPHEEEGYPCNQEELDYGCLNYVRSKK